MDYIKSARDAIASLTRLAIEAVKHGLTDVLQQVKNLVGYLVFQKDERLRLRDPELYEFAMAANKNLAAIIA